MKKSLSVLSKMVIPTVAAGFFVSSMLYSSESHTTESNDCSVVGSMLSSVAIERDKGTPKLLLKLAQDHMKDRYPSWNDYVDGLYMYSGTEPEWVYKRYVVDCNTYLENKSALE